MCMDYYSYKYLHTNVNTANKILKGAITFLIINNYIHRDIFFGLNIKNIYLFF